MSANEGLLEILKDALGRLGTVDGRRMFGGLGVYFDGTFFAIIDDGVLYFRTSEATRPNFEAEHSHAFTYATKNGPAALQSYWRVPERLLDDPDNLRDWANDAVAAAHDVRLAKERKRQIKPAPARVSVTATTKPKSKSTKR
jgi:DNA transformation protein